MTARDEIVLAPWPAGAAADPMMEPMVSLFKDRPDPPSDERRAYAALSP